jgi:hypothetical protein
VSNVLVILPPGQGLFLLLLGLLGLSLLPLLLALVNFAWNFKLSHHVRVRSLVLQVNHLNRGASWNLVARVFGFVEKVRRRVHWGLLFVSLTGLGWRLLASDELHLATVFLFFFVLLGALLY